MKWLETAVVCAAVSAAGSFAGAGRAWGQEGDPCGEDAQRLCPDMEPGSGELRDCMQSHREDLSDECKQAMTRRRGGRGRGGGGPDEGGPDEGGPGGGMMACREDSDRLCSGMEPGSEEMGGCMQEHMEELSDGCRQAMEKMGPPGGGPGGGGGRRGRGGGGPDEGGPGGRGPRGDGGRMGGGGMSACREDAQRLCSGMERGSGELKDCMQSHRDDLSDECRQAMTRMRGGRGPGGGGPGEGGPGGPGRRGRRQGAPPGKLGAVMKSCDTELKSLCGGAVSGPRASVSCLKQHADKVSEDCWNKLKALRPKDTASADDSSGGDSGESPAPSDE